MQHKYGPRRLIVAAAVLTMACTAQHPTAPDASSAAPGSGGLSQVVGCEPDLTAPTITGVSASPNVLWPPNHKMWNVAVRYTASDNCGGPVSCRLGVTSDEPVNDIGDGNTAPDWVVVSATQVQLRAERQGPRDGREYTITVTCTDPANNIATRAVTVSVPHDQRK
jgi:hypothetical protein